MTTEEMNSIFRGVHVQTSTLGEMEELLTYLEKSPIPVNGIALGPVCRKHVISASKMLDHHPEFAVILALNVGIECEAAELGVKIFHSDNINNLVGMFKEYYENVTV